MNNLEQIQMVPVYYESNMPIAWDIKFINTTKLFGSIEKCDDGFMVTTIFNDAFIADDNDDLSELLTDLFCPGKNEIN